MITYLLSFWEREALQLIDEGDYDGAQAILRDAKRKEELQTALRMAEAGKEGKRFITTRLVRF